MVNSELFDVSPETGHAGPGVSPASPKPRPRRAITVAAVGAAMLAVILAAASLYIFFQEPEYIRRARAFVASLPIQKVVEHGGRKWLWAKGRPSIFEKAEWFDVTDAKIPPEHFQHGIGKDTIAAIDDAVFVRPDDSRLAQLGVGPDDSVVGYEHNGEAKAYPIRILAPHELANDTVGGKPVTVGY